MDRRTLGLILAIIPLIAVIAALVIAFALSGDVQSTVIETGPDEVISGYISGFSSGGDGLLEVSGYSFSDDESTVNLKIAVTNPIDYPLVISSMSYTAQIGGNQVTLALEKPVEVPPEGSADIMLSGELGGGDLLTSAMPGMPQNPDPSDIYSEISFAGIILKNNAGSSQGVE